MAGTLGGKGRVLVEELNKRMVVNDQITWTGKNYGEVEGWLVKQCCSFCYDHSELLLIGAESIRLKIGQTIKVKDDQIIVE